MYAHLKRLGQVRSQGRRQWVNRPGVSGDSDPWEGLGSGHVGKRVEEVPAGVAGAGGADGRRDPREDESEGSDGGVSELLGVGPPGRGASVPVRPGSIPAHCSERDDEEPHGYASK